MSFASAEAWERWLEQNHETSPGLWLKIAKKGAGIDSVTYAEALDVALCFGWIDGQKGSWDEHYFLQRFTPRGKRSKWSQVNREHIARLTAEGRMRPAGVAEVERAKADGRWDAAYAPPSRMEVPDDLRAALDADPAASAAFESLDRTNRYAMLFRLADAKRPETRARRLTQYVEMLARGEKLYP